MKLNSEAQQFEAAARHYTKERRAYIQSIANEARIALKPLEMDAIYDTANGISQGAFGAFKEAANRELADFLKKNPDRVRHSAFDDWMDESMNDQEKARREIASWGNNPKIVYFDTETTGWFDEGHVPVTAAACNVEDTALCDIKLAPLNDKGEFISITEGASKANHLTDAVIAGYQPLEENEWAIRELEILMESGYILTGYNTKFDRDMMCRALNWAMDRIYQNPDPDVLAIYKRLEILLAYFKQPENWLETKDAFCRAVGEEPYPGPGKYLKLEDIARRTNALTADEKQAHGALADCQLLARIVRNIRKEIEDTMPKPKNAPVAKETEEIQTEPETELSAETQQYIETLETSLNALQGEKEVLETRHEKALDRIRELENQCEQYQQGDGLKHHEARSICFTDIVINGYPVNFTVREGYTPEAAVEDVFKHVRTLMLIQLDKRVTSFKVGIQARSDFREMKAVSNGKPVADEQPPADDRPATPKGNPPPAANKPNMPPKPANAPAPQQQQPGNPPQGKTTGEKKSQQCDRIIRHQIDGQNTYDLPFTLNNGKPAERPFAPSKKDTAALEKALLAAGYDLNTLDIGTEYDLPIKVEWTVGNQIPNSNPPKYYRDNMTFTIEPTIYNEENPF